MQRTKRGSGRAELLVPLTVAVWQEGDEWVARVLELEVATQADSEDGAFVEAMDAACAYLNTLEELGERERVFAERSIEVYEAEPSLIHPAPVPSELVGNPGFSIRPASVPLAFAS